MFGFLREGGLCSSQQSVFKWSNHVKDLIRVSLLTKPCPHVWHNISAKDDVCGVIFVCSGQFDASHWDITSCSSDYLSCSVGLFDFSNNGTVVSPEIFYALTIGSAATQSGTLRRVKTGATVLDLFVGTWRCFTSHLTLLKERRAFTFTYFLLRIVSFWPTDWALLSRLEMSLSSGPLKRSRKESCLSSAAGFALWDVQFHSMKKK